MCSSNYADGSMSSPSGRVTGQPDRARKSGLCPVGPPTGSQVTGWAFDRHRGGEMSRALEPPLAHLRKHLQRPEVLNALVLRIFLSRGLDFLFSLLADQSRQYQNHPAPRAGCLAHPALPHFPARDRPPLDNSHPAALALPPALAAWPLALLPGTCRHHRRPSVRCLGPPPP